MSVITGIKSSVSRLPAFPAERLNLSHRLGLVVFDGFGLADVVALIDLLCTANAIEQRASGFKRLYMPVLLSESGGTVASASGMHVATERLPPPRGQRLRIVFVAGGVGAATLEASPRLCQWLRDQHELGVMIVPIAEGRRLIEAAGLFVKSAGEQRTAFAAAMAMIAADLGELVAARCLELHGPAQTEAPAEPEVLRPVARTRVTEQILASARWLETHHEQPVSIADAAHAVAMSERNFLRRFKLELGMTPSDYLLGVRLRRSCKLLTETDLPIDKIARRCGIGDGGRLAKIFRKHLARSPGEYRAGTRARTVAPQRFNRSPVQ
ncbi:GlxA family transcriptional regulator [Pseudoxanthomonas winnipegensis]|uniref:GlxA family transcriptional regulator n=1 Tax=Pseudoxanthomonas winnipegensis TaxID=2480810 RepID=UPI003F8443A7